MDTDKRVAGRRYYTVLGCNTEDDTCFAEQYKLNGIGDVHCSIN